MTIERLHAMFADACFGNDPPPEDLRTWLVAQGIATDDVDALVASRQSSARLGLYRRLVRHNVVNVVGTMLPRTRRLVEASAAGAFDALVDAFMHERGPKTPHLRDVPSEFLAFAEPRLASDARLPRWIADHARLELVDFTVSVAPAPSDPPPLAEPTADRSLVFREPAILLRLDWPVHTLDVDEGAVDLPCRAVTLLVYRDDEHRPRYLELTPVAAAILERLLGGAPLGAAVADACKTHGIALDADVLAGAARLLGDLGDRGVLLGAQA